MRALVLAVVLLTSGVILLAPTPTQATFLWGHPYAMFYDREISSPNYDIGFIYLWNEMNAGSPYCGSARITGMESDPRFAIGTWDAMKDALLDKKLVGIYTGAGPDTNVNDGSVGELEAFVLTIYGP